MTGVDPAMQAVVAACAQRLLKAVALAAAAEHAALLGEGHAAAPVATGQISAAMTFLFGTLVQQVAPDLRQAVFEDAVRRIRAALIADNLSENDVVVDIVGVPAGVTVQ